MLDLRFWLSPSRRPTHYIPWLICFAGSLGCGTDADRPPTASATSAAANATSAAAGGSAGEPTTSPAPPDEASEPAKDGEVPVPDGTPEELFDFMQKIELEELGAESDDAVQPAAPKSPAAQGRSIRRVMRARLAACDKILARQIPEETRTRAIGLRLDALRTLAATDPDHYASEFTEYLNRLDQGSDPFLARMAKATRLQTHINDFISTPQGDSAALLDELRKLLADPESGPEVMTAARDGFGWAFQQGEVELASQAFRLIGERFRSSPDANLAQEAQSLGSQAINIQLSQLARGVLENKPEAGPAMLAMLTELIDPAQTDPNVPAYAMQTAQFFEFSGHATEAEQAYQLILARYQDSSDTNLAATVKTSVELALRRLKLIGSQLTLQGVQISGNAFDWESYRGKWVIVAFWTTWHTGWPAEVEHLRKVIRDYREPAVEVVSISLDDHRGDLEKYLREQPAPWPVLVNADPNAAGFENENAIRCGVEAVPFVLLVDPTGQVVDIHLTQDRLTTTLQQHVKK